MTNPSGNCYYTTSCTPLTRQLERVFDTIPEDELLGGLKTYYAGRCGYTRKVLWRTYVAMTVMNLPSFAALIRALEDNPFLAQTCGIAYPDGIPSKFAYSRFMRRLQSGRTVVLVKNIMRNLTRRCYETFPGFGKSVAIDATDLKAWSNGSRTHKADPDAGWVIKSDSNGVRKFVWGYKMHLMVDTEHEIPITAKITKGNTADVKQAAPLLSQARYIYGKFHPEYVTCDAAYSSEALRKAIRKQFHSEPIIRAPKTHKKWKALETPEWAAIFNRRTAVERVFGRLKDHRRLNNITVRRLRRVTVHCLLPIIVTQAMALAFPHSPRRCVRTTVMERSHGTSFCLSTSY